MRITNKKGYNRTNLDFSITQCSQSNQLHSQGTSQDKEKPIYLYANSLTERKNWSLLHKLPQKIALVASLRVLGLRTNAPKINRGNMSGGPGDVAAVMVSAMADMT